MDRDFELTVPKIPLSEILANVKERATEEKERRVVKQGFWSGVLRFFKNQGGWTVEKYKALNAEKYFQWGLKISASSHQFSNVSESQLGEV